jgi:hypothetical protein
MVATAKLDSKILKIIATVKKRDIKNILGELVDDYIERHKKTLQILSRSDWMHEISKGASKIERGETVKWKKLKDAGK